MEVRLGTENREWRIGGVSQSERVGVALGTVLPGPLVVSAVLTLACATTTASTPVIGQDMHILDSELECERTEAPELLNARTVFLAIERELWRLSGSRETPEDRRTLATTLYFFIDELGIVTELQVQTSSGSASWDQTVLRASRTARFQPATCDGEPLRVRISLPVTFTRR